MQRLIQTMALFLSLCSVTSVEGKLKVMTTTTNLKSLVEKIGGEHVTVTSFSRGTQDPHYLEAKPSFMLKASKADLLVSVGLELEVGWLPLILKGARNPSILLGNKGHFVAGEVVETLGKPKGEVSRAQGDVHSEGNPHFMLDPKRALRVGKKLKDRLCELVPEKKNEFQKHFDHFQNKIEKKLESWKAQIPQNLKVITYHKTLTYFYHRFGIENVAILEPKPGVPPTASHILSVMKKAKSSGVKLALVENYFDPTVAHRVARDVNGLKVVSIPVAVGGEESIKDLFDLYEKLVSVVSEE